MAETLTTATVVLPRLIGARTKAAALVATTLAETPEAEAIVIDASGNQAAAPGAIDELVKRAMEHLGWERKDRLQLVGEKPKMREVFDEQLDARTPR